MTTPHEPRPASPEAAPAPAGHFVSLARLAPGSDVLIEMIGPAALPHAHAHALQPGQFAHCRARGSGGVVLEVPGHGEIVVPDALADAILVRPAPAD